METIYNTIGTGYNSTRQDDPFLTSRLLHFLNPQQGMLDLDLGRCIGNHTIDIIPSE